ncbi:hypothetical protein Tco_0564243 [Tanacetum coccineum]
MTTQSFRCKTHAHIHTTVSEVIKKVFIQGFRTISENQCLLQILKVTMIGRRDIIKAFKDSNRYEHVRLKISVWQSLSERRSQIKNKVRWCSFRSSTGCNNGSSWFQQWQRGPLQKLTVSTVGAAHCAMFRFKQDSSVGHGFTRLRRDPTSMVCSSLLESNSGQGLAVACLGSSGEAQLHVEATIRGFPRYCMRKP